MGAEKSSSHAVEFDLTAQSGVMQALYAVRTSELDPQKKNELRDQIFAYTKSGGDERLRAQIEEKLHELELSREFLEVYKANAKTEAKPGFGGARRAPTFSVPTPTTQSASKNETSSGEDTGQVGATATETATPASAATPQETPQPNAATPTDSPTQVAPVQSEAAAQPAANSTPENTPGSAATPAANAAAAPASAAANGASTASAKESTVTTTQNNVESGETGAPASQTTSTAPPEPTEKPASATSSTVQAQNEPEPKTAAADAVSHASPKPPETPQSDATANQATQSVSPQSSPTAQPETAQHETAQPETEANSNSAPPSVAPSTPEATGAGNQSIQRIREIKRYINDKIGNPVNLVDVDDKLGRDYMAALLAAMQSVNAETGRAGATEMEELERVFAGVKPLLEAQGNAAATETTANTTSTPSSTPSTPASNNTPENTPEPTANTASSPAPAAPEQASAATPQATPQPNAATLTDSPTQVAPVQSEAAAQSGANSASHTNTSTNGNVAPEESANTPSTPQKQENYSTKNLTPRSVPGSQPQSTENTHVSQARQGTEDEEQEAVPMPTESANPPKAVHQDFSVGRRPAAPAQNANAAAPENNSAAAQSMQAESANNLANQLQTLDKKAAAANKNSDDPLYAPEVEGGLEQLLQEWNLFKSSGLFGTGPNGREHPLYKKLAPMMVQDVAQGRFSDARPEVVQSITDYMNGWRYEQGIVYEPGESFETYLRRVIRFIIDGKK